MSEWWMPALAAASALACLAAVLVLVRAHRRTRSELREALREQRDLRTRLERLDAAGTRGSTAPPGLPGLPELPEYVITDAGDQQTGPVDGDSVPGRLEGRLFADIVLRETLVKAASWGYGVRRALSPEQRNRLRFEVRRETRRTAKQRRADTKEALRQYYARERGDVA